VVLAEYTALAGNFQQATMQILQKLESFWIFGMEIREQNGKVG
jgi:hypothetical protein